MGDGPITLVAKSADSLYLGHMKGLIALDLDGTTVVPGEEKIPAPVLNRFCQLSNDGWKFVFLTGRTFHGGQKLLKLLPFPYFLAVQNGAILLDMPSHKVVAKKYLDKSVLPGIEKICFEHGTDFVLFSGYENRDLCYYRPHRFAPVLLDYLHARSKAYQDDFQAVQSFDELAVNEFASVKCIGQQIATIAQQIEEQIGLHVPLIRDPFNESYFVAQATYPDVSKGSALSNLIQKLNWNGPVIAAGDDHNDKSMLQVAHTSIVMASAPTEVKALAHIIAPDASQQGILEGLEKGIQRYEKK